MWQSALDIVRVFYKWNCDKFTKTIANLNAEQISYFFLYIKCVCECVLLILQISVDCMDLMCY